MATVVSTHQRHVLTPLSPKRRTVLGNVTNIVRGLQDVAAISNAKLDGKGLSFSKPSHALKPLGLTLSTSKRPFSSVTIYDENATTPSAPSVTSNQTKRMKSQLSSCEDSTIPKYALVTKPPVSAVPSGIVVSKKKIAGSGAPTSSSLKRRTNSSVSSSAATSVTTSSTTAQSRKDTLATLSSPSKTLKRKIQKSIRRVDPPSASAAKSVETTTDFSIDGRLIATPVSKTGHSTASTWRPGQTFPKSWMFDIHEDTLEETLTNLMYHGAGVLDISDEEDRVKKGMSEVDRVGKENIPPPPSEDVLAMPPPPVPGSSGRRGAAVVEEAEEGMDAERSRSPLGDVDVEVFYPNLKKEREEAERLKQQKIAEKKKAAGLMTSKFAVIDEIVKDYMAQKKDESSVSAENIPLPAEEEDDLEEEEEQTVEEVTPVVSSSLSKTKKVEVPTISVENCDFDSIIASQSRSMAEDELFDDDL